MSPSRAAQRSSFFVPSSPQNLSPTTPKRKRSLAASAEYRSPTSALRGRPAVALPRTPTKSPTLDSGIGLSVSPEKLVDESQTQPESPRWEVGTPRSSQLPTQPDSPQWVVKTPTKSQAESQTQPDSPQWEVKSPVAAESQALPESPRCTVKAPQSPQSLQTEPELTQWRVHTPPPLPQEDPSQTQPDSSQWRVHTPPPEEDNSQTQPESSQWVVRTPPQSQIQPRAYLPLEDEQEAAAAPSGSLPIAEYESQGPVEASNGSQLPSPAMPSARLDQEGDDSQSQPWDLDTQVRKEVARRLRYARRLDSDDMSQGPPSIPADFGVDPDLGDIDTQDLFAQPVKDFLGLR